jgi:hypothetical protein
MSRRVAVSFVAAVALVVPAAGGAQTTISNTQKYQDTSQSTAKGTTGGASLYARMLYSKNGSTDVEISTAEFDTGATPVGTVSKVSLRGVDGDGTEMFQLNYGPLTNNGYWSQSYTNFAPGQPFHVYGLVRTTRNDLVLLSTTVRRRPDLAARDLIAPNQATTGSPVQIAATIAELNGQVGARADCLLFVDDVEVDRANGIWVDSGDEISCAFSHVFSAAGSRALRVAAVNVRPGDWDEANNSVTASIEVVTPTTNYNYAQANVWEYDDYVYDSHESGRYSSSTATGSYDWQYDYHQELDDHSNIYYQAQRYSISSAHVGAIDFSATDGTTTWSVNQAVNACSGSGSTILNGRTVWWYAYGCGSLYVQFQAYAGTVTYMSRQFYHYFRRDSSGNIVYDPPSEYFSNGSTDYGSHRLTGGVVNVNAAVTLSDGTIYSTPLTVSLSAPQSYSNNGGNCWTSTSTSGSWSSCWNYQQSYTYRSGYTYYQEP